MKKPSTARDPSCQSALLSRLPEPLHLPWRVLLEGSRFGAQLCSKGCCDREDSQSHSKDHGYLGSPKMALVGGCMAQHKVFLKCSKPFQKPEHGPGPSGGIKVLRRPTGLMLKASTRHKSTGATQAWQLCIKFLTGNAVRAFVEKSALGTALTVAVAGSKVTNYLMSTPSKHIHPRFTNTVGSLRSTTNLRVFSWKLLQGPWRLFRLSPHQYPEQKRFL